MRKIALVLLTVGVATSQAGSAVYRVPLFPSLSNPEREGFVRVINRSGRDGVVTIAAIDDSGWRAPEITLAIGANETTHFNSGDLEQGEPEKGLSGATGSGTGDWRLALSSDLDIEVLTYVRTGDGLLTAMHDVVEWTLAPGSAGGYPPRENSSARGYLSHTNSSARDPVTLESRVAIFNPGSNKNQVSLLRLINPGAAAAAVTISGIDDAGEPAGANAGAPGELSGTVRITLPGGGAQTVSAAELESEAGRMDADGDGETGSDLEGVLGVGAGKWQLLVKSDRPVVVMSLLRSPMGHLTNLSTAPYGPESRARVTRLVAENAMAGELIGEPVTVSFGGDAVLTHALAGPDAESFDIDASSGQLRTREGVTYDFETHSSYAVTVRVSAEAGGVVLIPVTVEVTDEDEPPEAPAPPEVEGVSSRSVRVTWSEPENMGPEITGYGVGYRREGAQQYTDAGHEGVAREIEIGHLLERADYEFRVRASNDEGEGAWSEPTLGRARTGGGGSGGGGTTPPPPPVTDNGAPRFDSPNSFTVTENVQAVGRLRASDPDSADNIVGYAVTGRADGDLFRITGSGDLSFKAAPDWENPEDEATSDPTGAAGDNEYVLVVAATGGTGSRALTVEQTLRITVTDEDGIETAPESVRVTTALRTSLALNWTAPDDPGAAITHYDYRYRIRNSGDPWTEVVDTGVTTTETNLGGLVPDRTYEIQVRAANGEGGGPWSSEVTAVTQANHVPMFAGGTSTFSMSEAFALGETVGTPVSAGDQDGDALTYSLEGADASYFDIDPDSGQLLTWTGVRYDFEAGARFEMQVKADDGYAGSATTPVVVELTDAVERPLAPAAPTVKASSSARLDVRWEAPGNWGRPGITGYAVEYRTGGGAFSDAGHTGLDTELSIENLAENTSYEVQVRAKNGDGDGAWSPTGSGTTTVATPTLSEVLFVSDPGPDDTYKAGDVIEAAARFSEAVMVDTGNGKPGLSLSLGSNPREAVYARSSRERVLVFRYTVTAADADTDGAAIDADSLTLDGGSIKQDGSTVDAALTHAALTDQSGHKVDGASSDPAPSGVVATFAWDRSSAYTGDLGPCTYHGSSTVSCNFGRLPYLGAETDNPTVDDVMSRVLVSHRWMGDNFKSLLEQMPTLVLPLFRSIRAVVIANDIRPAYFSASRGAIYLDPNFVSLTPEQQAVVSDEPDYRSGYGRDLKFRFYARFVNAGGALVVRRNADGSRNAGDLKVYLGFLLFHELAHAADYVTPGRIATFASGQRPTDVARNDLSSNLTASYPLRSQIMKDLARVQFRGRSSTAAQRALRPRHVGAEFASDRAPDYYSYSTIREDLADLFDTAMTAYAFGYDTANAVTAVPESGERNDSIVVWGQFGRIADAEVIVRARTAVRGVYGNRQSVISGVETFLNGLPAPRSMPAGKAFGEALKSATSPTLTTKTGRLEEVESEDILDGYWIE